MTSADDPVSIACARLEDWVRNEALPFWTHSGCDLVAGGFHERIAADGTPLDEPRRARVVARQIYVFATALRFGWNDAAADRLQHGLRFLLGRMRLPSGVYAASVRPDGTVVDARFDLYEQAFVLFALATALRADPTSVELVPAAASLLACLREGWQHELGGFHASRPPGMPLQSNPHMHLLEAALEWCEVGAASSDAGGLAQAPVDATLVALTAEANALADELCALCLQRFVDPSTGAVHEHFDLDWRPMAGEAGRVVEPGHQFEWAWLLMRWGAMRGRRDAIEVAKRLMAIGEERGVDSVRGIAINQLHAEPWRASQATVPPQPTFDVVDASAKLWPQTERIKAWCAMADHAATGSTHGRGDLARADDRIVASVDGLLRYMQGAGRGRWHEQWREDGSFSQEPTRASSLYHIVCAAQTLKMCSARRNRWPL